MRLRRRAWLGGSFGAALAGLLGAGPAAAETALPVPRSLQESARAAAARGEPLLVLVSLPGCPYCELARRSYLLPLVREEGVHAVQIDVQEQRAEILGFAGEKVAQAELARRWGATFTPTLLFMGPKGQELAERLVGIAVPDFYGAYLEQRLAGARRRLKTSG